MSIEFPFGINRFFFWCSRRIYVFRILRRMFGRLVILWLALFAFKNCDGLYTTSNTYYRPPDLFELSLIHINDFHARFLETGPSSDTCDESKEEECIGGIARVMTASRKLREERPNAIFLNAGDFYQGTIWYTLFKWKVTAEFTNKLHYDVLTIGNHDFDDGVKGLVPFLEAMNCPVVVANMNVTLEPTLKGLFENSTIITRGDRKIGIIGVIISTTYQLSDTGNVTFLDEVETVTAESNKLKDQGVNIIIVLSHCGLDIDKIIAAKCPHVDIITGGHSHSFLYTGEKLPYTDQPAGEYPVYVKQEKTDRTVLIVQASAFTRYIGNLTAWFDDEGEIVDWDGDPILLNHLIEEDPQILRDLQPWKETANKLGKREVGSTKVYLEGLNTCRSRECNLGDFVADAMVDYYVGKDENKDYWTRAAIAILNAGAIRGDISNDPPIIRYEDVVAIAPFSNTFDLIELQGSDILQTLEKAVLVSYYPNTFMGKNFLQFSGLRVTYNLSNPDNSRVVKAEVRCQTCPIPKYDDIIPDEWYRVVVPSFLTTGGDAHIVIKEKKRNHKIGPVDLDVLLTFIKMKSPITYGTEGRITLIGTWNKN